MFSNPDSYDNEARSLVAQTDTGCTGITVSKDMMQQMVPSGNIGNFAQIMFDTGGTSQSYKGSVLHAVRTAPGSNDLVFTVEEGNTNWRSSSF